MFAVSWTNTTMFFIQIFCCTHSIWHFFAENPGLAKVIWVCLQMKSPKIPPVPDWKYLPGPFEGFQRVTYFGGTPVSSISRVIHYTILAGFLTVTCLGYSWAWMEIQVIDTSAILAPSLAFTRCLCNSCQCNIPGRASCPSGGCYNATISTMQVLLAGWPSIFCKYG